VFSLRLEGFLVLGSYRSPCLRQFGSQSSFAFCLGLRVLGCLVGLETKVSMVVREAVEEESCLYLKGRELLGVVAVVLWLDCFSP
jgi:hypothetical protein